ncbi:MAG: glycoside hydrolase, partial [Actinomycetota bacterium]|nr:glycoside hydrolase [Actinomycetota bacterium]
IFGGIPPKGQTQPAGYPNVVYFCAITGNEGAGSPSSTECSKTLDGGQTWAATGEPAYPIRFAVAPDGTTEPCDGAAPPGVVDSRGTIYIGRGWCGNPYIAVSRDEGATWKRRRVSKMKMPYDGGAWPNLAPVGIDDGNNLYVAWSAKNWHIYLSHSTDRGRSWSHPVDVTPPGVTRATMPAIDGGGRGKIALTFVGTESNRNSPGKRTWNGYIAESANALSAHPTFYAAPVQRPSSPLWKGGDCGPIRCGNLGDFFTVRIGPDGSVWAALVDSRLNGSNTSFGVTDPRGEAIVGRLVGGPDLR